VSDLVTIRIGRGVATFLLQGRRPQDTLAEQVMTAISNAGAVAQE